MTQNNKSSGFTLVELAIVMIIIGLLVGGILKGQELINNARVASTIKQIKSVEASALGFKDRYNALPGDAVATKVPGCTAANNCVGGDQNNAVGTDAEGRNSDGTDVWWITKLNGSGAEGRESFMFWKHLALAGFISGVDSTASVAQAEWGVTHPKTPFGGGFEFYKDGFSTIGFSGHVIRITRNGILNDGNNRAEGELTPSQAFQIDRKLDDGNPDQGLVFADYGTTNNECKTAETYRESNDGICSLFLAMFK